MSGEDGVAAGPGRGAAAGEDRAEDSVTNSPSETEGDPGITRARLNELLEILERTIERRRDERRAA